MDREYFLHSLARRRDTEIVVTTMAAARPWGQLSQHPLDFASADSAMGHAADFALGLALAQPSRRVICLNGDGSMLMALGTLATIIGSGATNLFLIVMQNDTYEITGNQSLPARGALNFAGFATSAGFVRVYECDSEETCELMLDEALQGVGPVFMSVKTRPGTEGPISRSQSEESRYLRISLADAAHELRHALAGLPSTAPGD